MTALPPLQKGDAFHHFQNIMSALLAVPKKEIDEQTAKWKRRTATSRPRMAPGHD